MARGLLAEGSVAAAVAAHAVLGEDADAVAGHQAGEAADVVLVRVCEERDIDAPIPDRDALVEPAHEQVRVPATIDEDTGAVVGLEEDRIALSDVEHRDVEGAGGPGDVRDRRGADEPEDAGRDERDAARAGPVRAGRTSAMQ